MFSCQVYHFEVVLRDLVKNIQAGTLGGQSYTLTLANGGLVMNTVITTCRACHFRLVSQIPFSTKEGGLSPSYGGVSWNGSIG